jgi:hypothetical protein
MASSRDILTVGVMLSGLLALILTSNIVEAQEIEEIEPHCIWHDSCGFDPDPERSDKCLNCAYDGPARQLSNTSYYSVLFEACPHFRYY